MENSKTKTSDTVFFIIVLTVVIYATLLMLGSENMSNKTFVKSLLFGFFMVGVQFVMYVVAIAEDHNNSIK